MEQQFDNWLNNLGTFLEAAVTKMKQAGTEIDLFFEKVRQLYTPELVDFFAGLVADALGRKVTEKLKKAVEPQVSEFMEQMRQFGINAGKYISERYGKETVLDQINRGYEASEGTKSREAVATFWALTYLDPDDPVNKELGLPESLLEDYSSILEVVLELSQDQQSAMTEFIGHYVLTNF